MAVLNEFLKVPCLSVVKMEADEPKGIQKNLSQLCLIAVVTLVAQLVPEQELLPDNLFL